MSTAQAVMTRRDKVINLACVLRNAIHDSQPELKCSIPDDNPQFALAVKFDGYLNLVRLADVLLGRVK